LNFGLGMNEIPSPRDLPHHAAGVIDQLQLIERIVLQISVPLTDGNQKKNAHPCLSAVLSTRCVNTTTGPELLNFSPHTNHLRFPITDFL
jgi:hypothetical protein